MTRWLCAITLALALALAGCKLSPGACSRHSDCPSGQCAATGTCAVGSDASDPDAEVDASTAIPPLEPDAGLDAQPGSPRWRMARGPWVPAAAVLIVVHAQEFTTVARHHGSPTGAAAWAWVATYAALITALAVTLGRRPPSRPARPPTSPGHTSPPVGDPPSSDDR